MEHNDYNQTSSKKSSVFRRVFQLALLLIFFALITYFIVQRTKANLSSTNSLSQADKRIAINNALFTKPINKSFIFPLREDTGREISKFTYIIDSIELRDQIVVKGQEATAIKGKRFLVINIKLTNSYDKPISVNARDYLRVIVGGSTEKIAPDMHSDPVDVQPISTKSTRLGLTIDDTVKNITLEVGEIAGKKEDISVPLQ